VFRRLIRLLGNLVSTSAYGHPLDEQHTDERSRPDSRPAVGEELDSTAYDQPDEPE
jgi:hypothetical protein